MKIAIATDAWAPQVNGVVRTLQTVSGELERMGHEVMVVAPDQFRSVPCPGYAEIRLAMATRGAVGKRLAAFAPDAIHIATEGPIGLAARRWCLASGLPFTTAYHTQFPDYLAQRTHMPAEWFWSYIRWFHAPSASILVSTPSIAQTLRAHGLPHIARWGRGVDLALFRPDRAPHPALADLPKPVQLYVGRVAIEKNLDAFLSLNGPGTKVIVGDGPARAALARRYPDAVFVGALSGEALASAYVAADVFVFPSRTDTFGLVMIEALASGTPVAAYPVPGPIDVLSADSGAMDVDLGKAIEAALTRDRAACAAYGRTFSWEASARQFLHALAPMQWQDVA